MYDIDVVVSQNGEKSTFQSNEFILSMINYINNIHSQLKENNYAFSNNFELDEQSKFFIFSNSDKNVRNQMYAQTHRLK